MQFEIVHHRLEHNPRWDRSWRDFADDHDYSHGVVQQAIGCNVILEVPDFYGGGDTDVFLDWLHSMKFFFDFHSIPEGRGLKFAEAKLGCGGITIKRSTYIWILSDIGMI